MIATTTRTLIAMAPNKIRNAFRRFMAARALEASRRNCAVLIDHIEVYRRELDAEQRRQAGLSSELARLK